MTAAVDKGQLMGLLDASISIDNAARTSAMETFLAAEKVNPHTFCESLVQISLEAGNPQHSQASAILFKNVVKRTWNTSAWTQENKTGIRDALVQQVVVSRPSPVVNQLVEALRIMISSDFPAQWPDLVAKLSAGLNSGENFGGLMQVVRLVAKQYVQFRNETGAKEAAPAELEELCSSVVVPLCQVFHNSFGAACSDEEWDVLLSMVKTYRYVTNNYLPASLVPHIDAWNNEFVHVLNRVADRTLFPVSENGDDDIEDDEERQRDPRQKVVRRIMQILASFQKTHKGSVLKSLPKIYGAVKAVVSMPNNPLCDRTIATAYNYLAAVGECDQGFRFIERDISSILEKSIFPTLCMTDKDADMWWDPEEYVRCNLESDQDTSLESAVTARKSALALLKALAALEPPKASGANGRGKKDKRKKKAAKVNPFKNLIFTFLDKIHNSFDAAGKTDSATVGLRRSARQKAKTIIANVTEKEVFGSIIAHGALSSLMDDEKASALENNIRKYILPYASADLKQLTPARAFLLANACWALGMYAEHMPENLLQTVFNVLSSAVVIADEVIGDSDFDNKPIRMAACHALRSLLQAQYDSDAMKPILPNLCQVAFDAIKAEAPCVDQMLSVLSMAIIVSEDAILQYASGLTEALVPEYIRIAEEGGDSTSAEILTALTSLVEVVNDYDFDEEDNAEEDEGDKPELSSADVKAIALKMAPVLASLLASFWEVDPEEAALPFQADGGDWSGNYVSEATDILSFVLRNRDPEAQDLSPQVWSVMTGFCASLPHWSPSLLDECGDVVEGCVLASQVPGFAQSPFVTGSMSPLSQIIRAALHMYNDPDLTIAVERTATQFLGSIVRHVKPEFSSIIEPSIATIVKSVNERLRANIDGETNTPYLNAALSTVIGQCLYRSPDTVAKELGPNGTVQFIKDATFLTASFGTKEFDAMCAAAAVIGGKWADENWLQPFVLNELMNQFAGTIVDLKENPVTEDAEEDGEDEEGDEEEEDDLDAMFAESDDEENDDMADSDEEEDDEEEGEESEADFLARYAEIALKIDEGSFVVDDDAADTPMGDDVDFGVFDDVDGVQLFSNVVQANGRFMSAIGPGVAQALTHHVPVVAM